MHDTTTVGPTGPSTIAPPAAQSAIQGYDRADLDRYLAECAQERAGLERELAAARTRVARARVALDAQRVLTSMVSEVCGEISAKRRQADLVVARIAKSGLDVEPEAALRGRRTPDPSGSAVDVPGGVLVEVPGSVDPENEGAAAIRWRAADAVAVR